MTTVENVTIQRQLPSCDVCDVCQKIGYWIVKYRKSKRAPGTKKPDMQLHPSHQAGGTRADEVGVMEGDAAPKS